MIDAGPVLARRQRRLVALVQVFALAVWFSMSAVVPSLRAEWGISSAAAVWLTASAQLGFVTGALGSTALNLSDRIRPHILLAASAFLAALTTVCLALFVDSLAAAIPLRFLTGVFLAGVYPVGMKVMASWSDSAGRGRALGLLIAALTVGSLLPHLIAGFGPLPWQTVMGVAAGIGTLGAAVSLAFVRPGPHLRASAPTRNAAYGLTMFTQRGPRLATLGYLGHMWELYALWTWIPAFLLAVPSGFGSGTAVAVFLTMGIAGAVGCLVGGWGADRYGRSPTAVAALVVSGACCLLSPLAYNGGPVLLAVFGAVWGASVIADSGVFSTSLSEVADPRFVGTALAAQTAFGFLLTVVSIQLVAVLADGVGWQYAFLLLAPGPVVGAIAMRRFGRPA
ncbi:MAG: MFS transporter [Pseudonocardia sp.]|uniref:MFS transporter n=1 Tax=unclassified Pseudonocardia TaxID=2619320 RepID=UPI00086B6CE5|nr:MULTISPECIES: MFS transporter [unclassified Pseudonocardia]MBN9112235.1 MFS transporter [Pseudonocardia sp.]ODU30170.1 MAG: MFS transporter [Pseudonocardia sp. SCN 72-51]ODV03095.1 MAG: MFS transporter [Pseudonocardia sp. SCN 73-27]